MLAGVFCINTRNFKDLDPPLPIWKSSLSATFSRETANAVVQSEVVRDLLHFLRPTYCPGKFDRSKFSNKCIYI